VSRKKSDYCLRVLLRASLSPFPIADLIFRSSFDPFALPILPLSERGRTKSRRCARGRSEGQMAAADFAVSVYSDKRPRTGEEHKRKKTAEERDKKDDERGRGRPKAFCSPFTARRGRIRKTGRVKGENETRTPRSERARERD